MTLARLDVSDYDDTELGAEVRAAFAAGKTMLTLFDGKQPDRRAETWVDGMQGLFRMHCIHDHIWLTEVTVWNGRSAPRKGDCPTCGLTGAWFDA